MKTFFATAAAAVLALAAFVQTSGAHASSVAPVSAPVVAESGYTVEPPAEGSRVIEASPIVIVGTVAKAPKTAKVQGWFCTSMRENLVGGYNADCRTSL
jgi:hypothetical protein